MPASQRSRAAADDTSGSGLAFPLLMSGISAAARPAAQQEGPETSSAARSGSSLDTGTPPAPSVTEFDLTFIITDEAGTKTRHQNAIVHKLARFSMGADG